MKIPHILMIIMLCTCVISGLTNFPIRHGSADTLTDWSHRYTIEIDANYVMEDFTNFPILVYIKDDRVMASNATSTGDDIMFYDSTNTTQFAHEIETWDSNTGELAAWVNIPTLSESTNTYFNMYFGNSGSGDQRDVEGTWDANYVAVYHMNSTSGLFHESNNDFNGVYRDASPSSDLTATGIVGTCVDFDGGGDETIYISDEGDFGGMNGLTVESWFNVEPTGNSITIFDAWDGDSRWLFRYDGNNDELDWVINRGGAKQCINSVTVEDGYWKYYAGVYNDTLMTQRINTTQLTTTLTVTAGAIPTGNEYCHIGSQNTSTYFIGHLDEIRISNIARTNEWLDTTYNFIANNSECIGIDRGLPDYQIGLKTNPNLIEADLTDYPILINISSNISLATRAFPHGGDICFYADDNTTQYYHELEYFDNTTGQLVAWVKIPTLDSSDEMHINMYYGSGGHINHSNKTNVWDDNFVMVHHMNSTSYEFTDSTNQYNGTFKSTTPISNVYAEGIAGECVDFYGEAEEWIYIPQDDGGLTGFDSMTVEAWVMSEADTNIRSIIDAWDGSSSWLMREDASNDEIDYIAYIGGNRILSNTFDLDDSSWDYAVGIYDGSEMSQVRNTTRLNDLINITGTIRSGTGYAHIGVMNGTTALYIGHIDEVRVSNIDRGTAWINTTYNTIGRSDEFITGYNIDVPEQPDPPDEFTLKWHTGGNTVYAPGQIQPLAVDLNGSGYYDIFVNGVDNSPNPDLEWIYCINGTTGVVHWRENIAVSGGTGAGCTHHSSMEIYDLDNDGNLEIVCPSDDGVTVLNAENGDVLWYSAYDDYPENGAYYPSNEAIILVMDTDGTGFPYIYITNTTGSPGDYSFLWKINGSTGALVDYVHTQRMSHGGLSGGDLDGDGDLEIYRSDRNLGFPDGSPSKGAQVYDADTLDLVWYRDEILCSSHCANLIDVTGDGVLDVVVAQQLGSPSSAGLYCLDGATGVNIPGMWEDSISGLSVHETMAIYDIDDDGNLEVFTSQWNNVKAFDIGTWSFDSNDLGYNAFPPFLANVVGDDHLEIITACRKNRVEIYDYNYTHVTDIILSPPANSMSIGNVQDVDGDGLNELIVVNATGTVYCYDTLADAPAQLPRTNSFMFGEYRRGAAEYYPAPLPATPTDIVVRTDQPSNIQSINFTMHGTLEADDGEECFVRFEWGDTTSMLGGHTTTNQTAEAGDSYSVSVRGNLSDWYHSGWRFRKQITVNKNHIDDHLQNFPLLINNTDTDFSWAQADGDDFLFTSSDGVTKLHHEIERYQNYELLAWVNVTHVDVDNDTSIWLYWGNSTADNQQFTTGVWDLNTYVAVYHMDESSGTTAYDSTSNYYNANYSIPVTRNITRIGHGQYFTDPQNIDFPIQCYAPIMESGSGGGYSIQLDFDEMILGEESDKCFFNISGGYADAIHSYFDGKYHKINGKANDTTWSWSCTSDQYDAGDLFDPTLNQWVYHGQFWDDDYSYSVFDDEPLGQVHGKEITAEVPQGTYELFRFGGEWLIAPDDYYWGFVGAVDEIRIYEGHINTSWLKAEGYSANSTEGFITYGTMETEYSDTGDVTAGTLYHYKAIANHTTEDTSGYMVSFLTRPYAPELLAATAENGTAIELTWTQLDGSGYNTTYIERHTQTTPWVIGQGTEIYNDTALTYVDHGLSSDTTYYYQAWSSSTWTWNNTDTYHQYSSNFDSAHNSTNHAPDYSTFSPQNNSRVDVAVNFSISLYDTEGDTFNYTVEIDPQQTTTGQQVINGRDADENDQSNLTVTIPLNCSHNITYYWFVNTTDGMGWGNFTGNFTTYVQYVNPPNSGISKYWNQTQYLNISWDNNTLNRETQYIVVMRNDTFVTTTDDTFLQLNNTAEDWIRQNNTCHFYNISWTETSGGYFTVYSWNSTSNMYSRNFTTLLGSNINWGALKMSCYDESNNTALDFDITISNEDLDTYRRWDLQTSTYVDMNDIPYGDDTIFYVEPSSDNPWYNPRTYYYDLALNNFYNLEFYLSSNLSTELYLISVINEYDDPVDDARVQFMRYINGTDTWKNVSILQTDGYGQADVYLYPGILYRVRLSKTGYITSIEDYVPSDSIFTKTFRLYFATDSIVDNVTDCDGNVQFSMSRDGNDLYVNYTDSLSQTVNTTIYVYEQDWDTGDVTLFHSWTNTSENTINVHRTVDSDNTYIVYLYYTHETCGNQTLMLTVSGQRTVRIDTSDEELNTLFNALYGTNPFGWHNVIALFVVMLSFFSFGQRNAGLALMMGGGMILFLNIAIGICVIGFLFPVSLLLLGFLRQWSIARREERQ